MVPSGSRALRSGASVRMFTSCAFLFLSIALILSPGLNASSVPDTRRNILMIIVDDLRPELGMYQSDDNILKHNSPRLDDFAKTATTFYRAFANYGSCNPSRNSLLTGVRPEDLRLYTKDGLAALKQRRWSTLPTRLRKMGYHVAGVGKIFHQERPHDFTTYVALNNQNFKFCPQNAAYCTIPDPARLVDNTVANYGRSFLLKQGPNSNSKPFCLILGIHRPHVSYSVPTWAFDSINRAAVQQEITNANSRIWYGPDGVPASSNRPNSINRFPVLAQKESQSRPPLTPEKVIQEKVWYAAAVKWADYCIGRVLDALDSSKVRNSTIVVIMGDHGVHLGEFGSFGKSTPFEAVARVPLFIRVPWMEKTWGKATGSVVELKDIGSTLFDLITMPREGDDQTITTPQLGDGISQVPLLSFLQNKDRYDLNQLQLDISYTSDFCYTCFAVTTNSRCSVGGGRLAACETLPRIGTPESALFVVLSLRSPRHRYVEFRVNTYSNIAMPISWGTGGLRGRILLSHEGDDGRLTLDASVFERTNLAPCVSCGTSVFDSKYAMPSLPRDDVNANYFPPNLDQLPPNIAMLVAQYSTVLRSLIRDKNPVCYGHGLPTTNPDVCQCYPPWLGPDCRYSVGEVLPGPPTPAPTSEPTIAPSSAPITPTPTMQPTIPPPTPPPTPQSRERQLSHPCRPLPNGAGCASYVLPCSAATGLNSNNAKALCTSLGATLCPMWQLKHNNDDTSEGAQYICPGPGGISNVSKSWWWTSTRCTFINRTGEKRKGTWAVSGDGRRSQCRQYIAKFSVQCCVRQTSLRSPL